MDDTCFVCNELLEESLKSDLSLTTNYSEKPIYQIIGKNLKNFNCPKLKI